MIGESAYLELMKGCSRWNERMNSERSPRLPYFDKQTRIAQRPRPRDYSAYDRRVMHTSEGTVYAYETRPWKRQGEIPLAQLLNIKVAKPNEDNEESNLSTADIERSIVEKEVSRYLEYEEMSDSPDDMFDNSDGEDYEETYSRKRRGGGGGRGGRRSTRGGEQSTFTRTRRPRQAQPNTQITEHSLSTTPQLPTPAPESKPHKCQLCSASYKSKAGLNYHMHHVHSAPTPDPKAQDPAQSTGPQAVIPNKDCDFCLGDAAENKRTGKAENLVACHDCGRAGHPSCLNFTANMLHSTKKYGWQCIECKSCAICGTSDNDDVLLFCDDCDRGFHLYCLQPPLDHAPEGEWSCQLCQVAFGDNASKPVNPSADKPAKPKAPASEAPKPSEAPTETNEKKDSTDSQEKPPELTPQQ